MATVGLKGRAARRAGVQASERTRGGKRQETKRPDQREPHDDDFSSTVARRHRADQILTNEFDGITISWIVSSSHHQRLGERYSALCVPLLCTITALPFVSLCLLHAA